MSMNLMAKAMGIRVGNPLRKLVLIKLADNANDKGECWPSYQHIADQCEIGRSTVKNHIRALEDMGMLRREFRRNGELNQSNLFYLTLDNPVRNRIDSVSSDAAPGQHMPEGVGQEMTGVGQEMTGVGHQMTGGGAPDDRGGGAPDDPITSHSFEPVIEPKETPVATAPLPVEFEESRYAFEGKVVRLNHDHFASWSKLYKNIDLKYELEKLDIEFSHEKPKNWFITASQKLSYQNKNARPVQQAVNAPTQHWNSREAWENEFL